jgi:FixJ family two-component response regulator
MDNVPIISVVDDAESVRESLQGLLKALGYGVEVFASAEDFLVSEAFPRTKCLILDLSMPGMNGLELQRFLLGHGERIPIIFITSGADEDIVSRMKANGAVACLFKPFTEESLTGAIGLSLSR